MYFAIIGDIISSKKLDERIKIQKELSSCLEEINLKYESSLAKKMNITLGDEFQGLFTDFSVILEIIHIIEIKIRPVKMRFGIGVGNLTFDLGTYDSPYNSDGQVWWNARKAIEDVKQNKSKNKLMEYSNIAIITDIDSFNKLINPMLGLCYSININWSEKQRQLIDYTILNYGLNNTFSISEVSTVFKQSTSTIHSKYKASKYANCVSIFQNINQFMIGGVLNVD